METLSVRTSSRTDMADITGQVEKAVASSGVREGVCVITVPHTTAGVTINENADPSVRKDMAEALERLVPWRGGYSHAEGNAAAHIKSALVGHSALLPVSGGKLVLGTWQGVFLCEFDGPRTRTCYISIVPASAG